MPFVLGRIVLVVQMPFADEKNRLKKGMGNVFCMENERKTRNFFIYS